MGPAKEAASVPENAALGWYFIVTSQMQLPADHPVNTPLYNSTSLVIKTD